MLRGACRYSIFRLKINLAGKPLTHHEIVEKMASEKMTTGCVLEAPKSNSVQLSEISHHKSLCDLEMGVAISIIKTTCFLWIYHLCCSPHQGLHLSYFTNPACNQEPVGRGQSPLQIKRWGLWIVATWMLSEMCATACGVKLCPVAGLNKQDINL